MASRARPDKQATETTAETGATETAGAATSSDGGGDQFSDGAIPGVSADREQASKQLLSLALKFASSPHGPELAAVAAQVRVVSGYMPPTFQMIELEVWLDMLKDRNDAADHALQLCHEAGARDECEGTLSDALVYIGTGIEAIIRKYGPKKRDHDGLSGSVTVRRS